MRKIFLIVLMGHGLLLTGAPSQENSPIELKNHKAHGPEIPLEYPSTQEYYNSIIKTSAMVQEEKAQALAKRYGLRIMNVTWEDTGRFKDSSVGPNISDMSIQVGFQDPDTKEFRTALMPVIRYPNFEDLSTDLSPWDFTLLVGNEKSQELQRISLFEFLEKPRNFLTDPSSWPGEGNTLLAPRDEKVLVSAQACFLPIPAQGKAVFNPVLFNYQSYAENPAVLTILVTREGSSVTIIDNTRDAFPSTGLWGQRLFFNRGGERASLTGERESEFLESQSAQFLPSPRVGDGGESGLNMVLLIQIPLKYQPREIYGFDSIAESAVPMPESPLRSKLTSDVENAVIGSGPVEGPFTEIDGVAIERDQDFPVRVTVQFYKATSNGIVGEKDMEEIAGQIRRVFDQGEYVSSLVTGGETGRPTEYYGNKVQSPLWWKNFWEHYEETTGQSAREGRRTLEEQLGPNYHSSPVTRLYLRDLLR